MGKIIPMAPLKVRLGYVRKREKAAKRAAQAKRQAALVATPLGKISADAANGREQ